MSTFWSEVGLGPVLLAETSDDGLVSMLENMFDAAQGLIILGLILVGMVFVIMTWMRTRSLVPTLGALVLGAAVVWGVSSFSWFANRIGSDVQQFNENESNVSDGLDRPGS